MFGYVVINKSELKFREFDEYQSYYCGLCTILEQKYGLAGKITLSYDMTFLYLLLSGLYEPKEKHYKQFCIAHPRRKRDITLNKISEYVADMNILLSYYKSQDNWQDEHHLSGKFMECSLQKSFEKIKEKYPQKVECIRSFILENNKREFEKETNLDIMAGLTGKIMEEIYAYREDEWEDTLRRMGFFLGKFIYLMDAWDDLEKDETNHCYNPLIFYKQQENFDEWCSRLMIMMISECTRAFEELPVLKNGEIIRNILYAGVWSRYKEKMKKRMKGEKDGSV